MALGRFKKIGVSFRTESSGSLRQRRTRSPNGNRFL